MIRNKKGQGVIWVLLVFAIIGITIIIIAPFYLRIMNQMKATVSPVLRNMSANGVVGGNQAANDFDNIMGRSISIWDEAMILLFVINLLILFISAFFMDTSPIWIIMYILSSVFVIALMPQITSSLDNLYYNVLAPEGQQLVYLDFIRVHYGLFLVGTMLMTMIIMFAKPYFFGRGTNYG